MDTANPIADRPLAEGEEKQLCLNCLLPNSPIVNFCTECGAPLSSYAATGPLESVFAEGHMYRQAVQKPRSATIVVGVWLLFGMMALPGIMPLLDGGSIGPWKILMAALFLPISLLVIWNTTTRYFANRKQRAPLKPAADPEDQKPTVRS